MRAAIAAMLVAAACANHEMKVPRECRAHGDSAACVGWVMDLVYVGASDLRYDDEALRAYVQAVALRVARPAGLTHVTVRLLDADSAEASALGGDIVYVDRGALARLASEAELAGLLAHEVTHLVARHTADLLHSDEDAAMSEDERLRRRDDDEALADERAVELVAAAGYDPSAVLAMMRAIQRNDDGTLPAAGEGLDRTAPDEDHPPASIRLARIARLVAGRRGGAIEAARYLAHVDGLVVGDDRRRGRVAGTTWIRAASRLAIDLPRGWKLDGERKVDATSPDGAKISISTVERAWSDFLGNTLDDVSHRAWAGRAIAIGLMRSSDNAAHGDADDTKVTVTADARGTPVAMIDDGARVIMIAATGTHAHASLVETIDRLRAATAAELAGSEPRRLRFHPAPRAGTIAAVTAAVCRDPAASRALDDPDRVVAVGDPIKCVEP